MPHGRSIEHLIIEWEVITQVMELGVRIWSRSEAGWGLGLGLGSGSGAVLVADAHVACMIVHDMHMWHAITAVSVYHDAHVAC